MDLVIVCSGIGELNPLLDFNIEYPTLLTNVVGWTYVVDAFYNILVHQGFGHLVAITSIGGLRGELQAPAYSASKAYVTKRWHILAIINKNLPYNIFKRM